MKVNKLHMDNRPEEQPQGTYPYAKNGINSDLLGANFNEPGFRKMAAIIPYKYNGIIETDGRPIIFSTDNTNSAIGWFNPETELYEAIIDDNPSHLVNWPAGDERLGLDIGYYITGQFQRNYKGEAVIAFTDKKGLPRYLNCDNPSISDLDDTRLFPNFRPPKIETEESLGGSLPAGAYYVAVGYERNDGTSTPYSQVSRVTIIRPPAIGTTTDKALTIRITEADTNYDYMRIAIISKVGGVTKAVELTDFLPISDSEVEFIYTGDNLTTDITVESILVQPAIYQRVGTIGQLNDYLYLGNLDEEPDINDMQPWALLVNIEWKSELINALAPPAEHVTGKKKSFMHQEVYSYYIRYRKTRGGFTKWYSTAGLIPEAGDLADSTEATTGGGGPVPKFKVEDTIRYFDAANKSGSCGIYQNDTERYPDTPDYDATAIGGPNLRNQLVLHRKMPSLRWCKENLYATEDDYGKTSLDILGIIATNVRIPDKYIGIIDGYEIGYAKRTVGNMTVYGQSVLLHGVVNDFDKDKATADATIYTSGGNWRTSVWHKGDGSFNNRYELVELRKDTFRFHAFDILFNKPSIEPTFIAAQLKMRKPNLRTEGYIEDGQENANKPEAFLIDYTAASADRPVVPTGYLRHISTSSYLPIGINANGFVNSRHENTFAGILQGDTWALNYGDSGIRVKGQDYTEAEVGCPEFEETYLINLIGVKANLYTNYYSQSIVSAGEVQDMDQSNPIWGGDTFVCDYTFHTYGRHETNDGWGDGIAGKKAIRRFVCESASNIHLRYEIVGNIYSRWYPRNQVQLNVDNNTTYIIEFDRAQDPNQFGYDKSLNALNDLVTSIIYNPFREEITHHTYRIHRGGKNTRTGRPRSWRTFLPLDYYEMQKNMGEIINLEGMDDKLLIHMVNALFYTQDKAKLEAGLLSVTLGTGDIFQFEPQEAASAKLGYAGTQHDLACVRTPMGYVFVDAKQGEMYIYKGTAPTNMNPGLNTFLRRYLKVKEKNVYTGNGVTIGWDQLYKRVLLSVKNRFLANTATVIKDFADTPAFWSSLSIGDIVRYNNRLIKYEGINPEESELQCPPDPPNPVYTWEPADPECILDDEGDNTGYSRWNTRVRRTDGVLDGYDEPNTPNGGIGPYFPPIASDDCPPPAPVITWEPSGAYCQQYSDDGCPDGYNFNPDSGLCEKQETMEPDIISSGYCIAESNLSDEYGLLGMQIYENIGDFDSQLIGTPALITTPYWQGNPPGAGETVNGGNPPGSATPEPGTPASPMNREGIWVDTDCDGIKNGLTAGQILQFSYLINVSVPTIVYVGCGGDNTFLVAVNGVTKVSVDAAHPANLGTSTNNFTSWWVFPIELSGGDNIISFQAIGDGSVNDAFAATIMQNTYAEIIAANDDGDLNFLFRTSDYLGETIDIATCLPGWILDTSGGSGNYVCRRTLTTEPTEPLEGNTGYIAYTDRCRLVDGYEDGYCEPNVDDDSGHTYFPEVYSPDVCQIEEPPPGPITIVATVTKDCNDHNCTEQGTVQLSFTFPEPTPANLEIWVGEIHKIFSGRVAFGWEIIPGPDLSGVTQPTYWEKAFLVTIPAGVMNYTAARVIHGREANDQDIISSWTCHNCLSPIQDLYFKLDNPNDGSYVLDITSGTSGVTAHIVT